MRVMGYLFGKFYGVEDLLATVEGTSDQENGTEILKESGLTSAYAAHRTSRLQSPLNQVHREKFVGERRSLRNCRQSDFRRP